MRSRRLSILVCAASLLLAAPAYAGEPSAADSESALQLYKEGKALRDAGDQQGALGKLRAAYALVETPITALELGRTYMAVGQLVEARGVLLSVSRIPVRNNESTKAGEARVEAESLAAQLRPRLASLTVHPKGASTSPPKIIIDNVVLPPDAATVPRVLNPGGHVVVIEVDGQRVQSDVSLAEGQSKDLDIDLPVAKHDAVAPVPAPTTEPPAPPEERRLSPLVWVGFGTAAVGIGVGTVAGILTLSKASALKDACVDGRCPSSSQSDIDSASATGTVSTVAFIVGGAFAVVGVVGLFMGGRSESAHASSPAKPRASGLRIVPTINGVGGSF
ncbi:MAG TPA: hypothetical protein VLT33_46025 [Labilithrix sp.]|nr:hypothetical protein [Labilithrix sp.]